MFQFRKYRPRRAEIRRNRPDVGLIREAMRDAQVRRALAVALLFWIAAWSISTLRQQMVRLRPGEYVHEDVLSRVRFESRDAEWELKLQQSAREAAPRVYRRVENAFDGLERRLLALPQEVARSTPEQLPRDLRLDSGTVTALKGIHAENGEEYKKWVKSYITLLREARDNGKLVVLPYDSREEDLRTPDRKLAKVQGAGPGMQFVGVELRGTFSRPKDKPPAEPQRLELLKVIGPLAEKCFLSPIAASIAGYTADTIEPTHELNEELTADEQELAAKSASLAPARRTIPEKTPLVHSGTVVTAAGWKLLAEEQRAYMAQMPAAQRWRMHLGMAALVGLLTIAMALYTVGYQPRLLRNWTRAVAVAALLTAMLLIAQLAGIGTGPLLIFGIAPTILAAMILCIAYDQRYAMGLGSLHALLVTAALGQDASFFLIAWLGVAASCFFLDEIRTRSKPIEVGGAAALAMMAAATALGAVGGDPWGVIGRSTLHVGAAGLGVGFIVLGILPFIEKAFRITTSMTLLELADVSQPLLKRLSMEAPGTYNHSLQVATLAEAAAEAISANPLLCRVGSYYHDIGKMNKAEYFCENQFDGRNRHLNLSPTVSLLVIIGHVKDGLELAREYNLPSALFPMIGQHHGTMLVEYFYHQACSQNAPDGAGAEVDDDQFRYPGPRPRSRETAIVMIADAVESACRAMVEPAATRIEALVHDLIMKRLLDGQFDECDLTFAELQQIERALVKMLLAIYHGRLAYPSTVATTHGDAAAGAVRSAG